MSLKKCIDEDMKSAMKAKETLVLSAIRLLKAQIRQIEIDSRVELDDAEIIAIIDKMMKQRRDSIAQYIQGGREDLADKERAEMEVLQRYLPKPFSEQEISALIESAIQECAVTGIQGMGKVMAHLKPVLAGKADIAVVSNQVKARLAK